MDSGEFPQNRVARHPPRIVGKLAVCANSWLIVSDVEGMCSATLSYAFAYSARGNKSAWEPTCRDRRRAVAGRSHAKPHADLDAIYVASLDGKENRFLTISTSNAIAVPGYLLFLQNRTLMAQPFDFSNATLKGEPLAIAQDVHFEEGNWHAVFDCASDGTLVY